MGTGDWNALSPENTFEQGNVHPYTKWKELLFFTSFPTVLHQTTRRVILTLATEHQTKLKQSRALKEKEIPPDLALLHTEDCSAPTLALPWFAAVYQETFAIANDHAINYFVIT